MAGVLQNMQAPAGLRRKDIENAASKQETRYAKLLPITSDPALPDDQSG